MAKGRSKNGNNTQYSFAEEKDSNFNSETEKCLSTSSQSGKTRSIFLCAIPILTAFVIGLMIGFFTKTQSCENNGAHIGGSGKQSVNVETLLLALDKEEIRRTLRYFSSQPHQAGSRQSRELAEEIKRRWNDYGLQVETLEYNVLLPRAKDGNPDYMEIKNQAGNVTFRHTFAAVGKSDPNSNKTWTIPRFYFYSPNGTAQGGLLYVNEGSNEDFEYLNTMNITSCNGSVLLMKNNFDTTVKQLKNAYECNASGILFFADYFVKSQTAGNGSVYPNGTRLPQEEPLIFGLRNDYMEVGDPMTPDLPASDGIYRLTNVDLPAKIPVQHVEFDLAMKLLDQLEGMPLPQKWRLDNTTNYRIGPSLKNNSTLHLTVNSKAQMTKVYDVIGTVYGSVDPDSWILLGNHRDAMSFGAADAGSGTAGMMELSRGVGELLNKGWKPRRTIKFCSWAAEETGIIGSTEYVEDNKALLRERAVAYLNMDMLVHGNDSLKASGNPMTADLIYEQSEMVPDPHGPQETIYSVWKKSRPDSSRKDRPQYYTVGFGSDYIPFYEIAGVPSIDLQYAKAPYDLPPSYHTVYDTYHYISMLDPHFQFHLAQIKLAARIVYKLSHSHLIPFNLNSFIGSLREIVNKTMVTYENELKRHGISLSGISKEVKKLANAAQKFEAIKKQCNPTTDAKKIRLLNTRMATFNKLFISPEAIPGRFSMRNLVLGISRNQPYPNFTLTGISDAFIVANTSGRWEIVKRQVSLTHLAITQARRLLALP